MSTAMPSAPPQMSPQDAIALLKSLGGSTDGMFAIPGDVAAQQNALGTRAILNPRQQAGLLPQTPPSLQNANANGGAGVLDNPLPQWTMPSAPPGSQLAPEILGAMQNNGGQMPPQVLPGDATAHPGSSYDPLALARQMPPGENASGGASAADGQSNPGSQNPFETGLHSQATNEPVQVQLADKQSALADVQNFLKSIAPKPLPAQPPASPFAGINAAGQANQQTGAAVSPGGILIPPNQPGMPGASLDRQFGGLFGQGPNQLPPVPPVGSAPAVANQMAMNTARTAQPNLGLPTAWGQMPNAPPAPGAALAAAEGGGSHTVPTLATARTPADQYAQQHVMQMAQAEELARKSRLDPGFGQAMLVNSAMGGGMPNAPPGGAGPNAAMWMLNPQMAERQQNQANINRQFAQEDRSNQMKAAALGMGRADEWDKKKMMLSQANPQLKGPLLDAEAEKQFGQRPDAGQFGQMPGAPPVGGDNPPQGVPPMPPAPPGTQVPGGVAANIGAPANQHQTDLDAADLATRIGSLPQGSPPEAIALALANDPAMQKNPDAIKTLVNQNKLLQPQDLDELERTYDPHQWKGSWIGNTPNTDREISAYDSKVQAARNLRKIMGWKTTLPPSPPAQHLQMYPGQVPEAWPWEKIGQ
jgi:hypothetical protein